MSHIDNLHSCLLAQTEFESWPADEIPSALELNIPDSDDCIIAELMSANILNHHQVTDPALNETILSPCTPHTVLLDIPYQSSFNLSDPSPLKRKASYIGGNSTPVTKKPALLSNFVSALVKAEPRLPEENSRVPLEPLAPSCANKISVTVGQSTDIVTKPTPLCHSSHPHSPMPDSACSYDDEPASTALLSSPLPTPSKAVAARRRAYRCRALKLSKARSVGKDELSHTLSSSEELSCSVGDGLGTALTGLVDDGTEHILDKKIARAIRNRQAAQRSRIEAKAKMQELAMQNDQLTHKVESLRAENERLLSQLKSLHSQSIGEGHTIERTLHIFELSKTGNTRFAL